MISGGQRIDDEPAYVIHRRRFRETSLIVEAFTASRGRVGLVARGARRARSRLNGVLQPFSALRISSAGRGDLATLRSAEAQGRSIWLTGPALFGGLYVNELIYRLCARHDPHPDVFSAYENVLAELTVRIHDRRWMEWGLRLFEKRLLQGIGYGLMLEGDAINGEALEPDRWYTFVPKRGPVPASHRTQSRFPRVEGAALIALRAETLHEDTPIVQLKAVARAALRPYLGARPIASRALFT